MSVAPIRSTSWPPGAAFWPHYCFLCFRWPVQSRPAIRTFDPLLFISQ